MNVIQWLLPVGTGSQIKSISSIGFEDLLEMQNQRLNVGGSGGRVGHTGNFILINTLSLNDQEILICRTTPAKEEETALNQLLETYQTGGVRIIVYGRNSADTSVFVKQEQIRKLGFTHVYVYLGGLFEWLLLQDVYGTDAFRTTSPCRDILRYSAKGGMII